MLNVRKQTGKHIKIFASLMKRLGRPGLRLPLVLVLKKNFRNSYTASFTMHAVGTTIAPRICNEVK